MDINNNNSANNDSKTQDDYLQKTNRLIIDNLRRYKIQNFSQLLNTPEDEGTYYSYLENFSSILYNSVYDEQASLNSEINEFFSSLTHSDIHFREIRARINAAIKDNSFNDLISSTLDAYVDKIRQEYKRYKGNHSIRKAMKLKAKQMEEIGDKEGEFGYNSTNDSDCNTNTNSSYNPKSQGILSLNKNYYKPNPLILDLIPQNFQIPSEKFKINKDILSKNTKDIQSNSLKYIEINCEVDRELEKILKHLPKLNEYNKRYLGPLDNNVSNFYERVKRYKFYLSVIRSKNVENSAVLILKGNKKRNLLKIRSTLISVKNMKETLSLLKVLILNPKKCKISHDLLLKSKENFEKLKQIKNRAKILVEFGELFSEYQVKNASQMTGEFGDVMNRCFDDMFGFDYEKSLEDEVKVELYSHYNIPKIVYDKLIENNNENKLIFTSLSINHNNEETAKIKGIIQYYIDNNLIKNIYTKLRGIFTNVSQNYLVKFKKMINDELLKLLSNSLDIKSQEMKDLSKAIPSKISFGTINTQIKCNNKNEICTIVCLLKCKEILEQKLIATLNDVISQMTSSDNVTKVLKENFEGEAQEIQRVIYFNTHKMIKAQIVECLHRINTTTQVYEFVNNFYLLYDICKPLFKKDSKLCDVFTEEQNNFIDNYMKVLLTKFNSSLFQNWESMKEIPGHYQEMLEILAEYDFSVKANLLYGDSEETSDGRDVCYERADKLLKMMEIKKLTNHSENEYTQSISFRNKDRKYEKSISESAQLSLCLNICGMEIIKDFFDIVKMFVFFSPSSYEKILASLTSVLNGHLNYQKRFVYSSNTVIIVSQNEICISTAIFRLVKYLFVYLKDNYFFIILSKICSKKTVDSYLGIKSFLAELERLSSNKIIELIDAHCVNVALGDLTKMELPNYNVVYGTPPVNEYALNIVSNLKAIYESMLNCYDDEFIINTINSALKKFFTNFENFIFHGKKIENENSLKQFKRDMVFLKKNLIFAELLDMSEFKSRIDYIIRNVLPDNMQKNKKNK